jgi:sugar lactone lactonase YvrE/thiol-disulfide isomerase/thioredoxin
MRRSLSVALLALVAAAGAQRSAMAEPRPELADWARRVVEANAAKRIAAPDFGLRKRWLNTTRGLTLSNDLRGKVVILDFWCYCCINCIHILPDLAWLEERYQGKAFAVVGVHSAKFENERDAENVMQAVVRYEIRHPVVVDDDFAIWNAYGASGWPHLAVVGPTGHVLWVTSGEGHREELDAIVTAALAHYGKQEGVLDARALPIRLERATRAPAEFAFPAKVAIGAGGEGPDAAPRLYVSDSNHHRVVELDLDGTFRRAFGSGEAGLENGPADRARFRRPQGLAPKDGWLYVADAENHAIRRIRLADGVVETVAGTGQQGEARVPPKPAREAVLSTPWDLLWVGEDLYVAMAGTHQIWRLDAQGRMGPFAGDGTERRLDAQGPGALGRSAFAQPSGLSFDGERLWVADSESSSVRAIRLPTGPVTTLAGGSPDPSNLHVFGLADGTGFDAKFQHPLAVLHHDGKVFVADTYNHAIRVVDARSGATTTLVGMGSPGASDTAPIGFYEPSGLALHEGRLYVADTNNHRIRTVDLATRGVSTLPTKGVPIPEEAARAGGTQRRWPDFPDTHRVTLPAVAVRAGKPATLRVRLTLPEGWTLTEEAPSAIRVEGLGPAVGIPVMGTQVSAPLPEVPEEGATLRIRLLYYVCREAGSCRIRSADLQVPLTPSPDANAPSEIAVEDAFVP